MAAFFFGGDFTGVWPLLALAFAFAFAAVGALGVFFGAFS